MLYTVVDVIDHSTMKEFVLDLIDNMPSKDVGVNSIKNNYPDRDWSSGEVTESWFNQYIAESGAEHPWHHHADSERVAGQKNPSIHLASIYYVELPDRSLTTILKDPETGEEIIPDLKEGQILTFASDILHKSPRNLSNTRKTVIPFNIMFD